MVRRAVVWLIALPAMAPAMAQTVVYQGDTTTFNVNRVTNHTYLWEIYSDASVNFATVPGNCPATSATFVGSRTGASINVRWLQPGNYFYKVSARDASDCAMNLKIGMLSVVAKEIVVILGFEETIIGPCQSIKLDASKSIGDNLRYEWSLIDQGGALTKITGVNTEFYLSPLFTGSLPADFRVRLLITDLLGNSQSDTLNITVDRPPVTEITSTGKLEKDGTMVVGAVITVGKALNYKWHTSEGKVVGPDNQPTANLFGAGIYTLEITDIYGCTSSQNFKFPIEIYQIVANPDYAKISWVRDTTLNVLANDQSNAGFMPGTVKITQQATQGVTKVNIDGSITYIPSERQPGRDLFVYEVCDAVNLCVSAAVTIDIEDISLIIPGGFSPNGDGVNEQLVFEGLENYPESELSIYTRSGLHIYQSADYMNDWDGKAVTTKMVNLGPVPAGVYYYVLKLGGTNRTLKGSVYIAY